MSHYKTLRLGTDELYRQGVGQAWTDTVDEHRRSVRDAVLDAAGALVTEQGLTAVTMSGLAERSGVGRATLYRYFPDLDAALRAWHERLITGHLDRLTAVRDRSSDPSARVCDVLATYAHLSRRHTGSGDHAADAAGHADHGTRARPDQRGGRHPGDETGSGADPSATLHQSQHAVQAREQLATFVTALLRDAVDAGQVRSDVPPRELAEYCLAALGAADARASGAAVKRLVAVTLDGLRPQT